MVEYYKTLLSTCIYLQTAERDLDMLAIKPKKSLQNALGFAQDTLTKQFLQGT